MAAPLDIADQTRPLRRARGTVPTALAFVMAVLLIGQPVAAEGADPGAALPAPDPTTTTTTTTTPPPTPTTSTPAATTTVPAPPTTRPATTAATTTTATTLPPPEPAPKGIPALPSQIANILATIRYVESRGNYDAPLNKGRASGAYQFITSTWNNYAGYSEAYLAPPEIQDERAALDVQRFLEQWNNDVSMIPVMWYYPRASRDLDLMDIVPVPSAGNVLTVREYQHRWLGVWAFLSGQPVPPLVTREDALARRGTPPELPPPVAVDPGTPAIERVATVAFPVLGPTRIAAPECGDAEVQADNAGASGTAAELEAAGLCAEEAPSVLFGVKLQPVLSPVDGVVTAVIDEPGEPIVVTVTDVTGRSFRLEGFNDDNPGTDDGAAPPHLRLTSLANVGGTVRAGQVLGFMGDTGDLPIGVRADVPTDRTITIADDAVAPHIRLTITDLDGTPVDAYGPVIDALFRQACQVATGPWSSPPNGTDHTPVTIETTDDDRTIDSEWVITADGQVTAAGWAAMTYPSEGCGFAPPDPHGPGAAGWPEIPGDWWVPIELPTSMWIDLAADRNADDQLGTALFMRP